MLFDNCKNMISFATKSSEDCKTIVINKNKLLIYNGATRMDIRLYAHRFAD